MLKIKFQLGLISANEQAVITNGLTQHSIALAAPAYDKQRLNWLVFDLASKLIGALTADLLWDWLYIDELWTDELQRGQGIGKKLVHSAENFAVNSKLTGLWLWTQSWQAAKFYEKLGYIEFARFNDFPKGFSRIGFRKVL